MRRHAAHNRHYGSFRQSAEAMFGFFDETPPDSGESQIDTTADNFRVIGRGDRVFVG